MTAADDLSAANDLIVSYLAEQAIPHAAAGDGMFLVQMRGERKLTIPVSLFVGDPSLVVESFFARRPIEGHAEVYRALLLRNARARRVHFALGDQGDVYLVGHVPLVHLDERALDELLGELLTTADEMFDPVIALGFASYLRDDLAWRGRRDPR